MILYYDGYIEKEVPIEMPPEYYTEGKNEKP